MKDKLKQYPLKIQESTFDKIAESAKKNDRSVNKEIIHAVRSYLRDNVI